MSHNHDKNKLIIAYEEPKFLSMKKTFFNKISHAIDLMRHSKKTSLCSIKSFNATVEKTSWSRMKLSIKIYAH